MIMAMQVVLFCKGFHRLRWGDVVNMVNTLVPNTGSSLGTLVV